MLAEFTAKDPSNNASSSTHRPSLRCRDPSTTPSERRRSTSSSTSTRLTPPAASPTPAASSAATIRRRSATACSHRSSACSSSSRTPPTGRSPSTTLRSALSRFIVPSRHAGQGLPRVGVPRPHSSTRGLFRHVGSVHAHISTGPRQPQLAKGRHILGATDGSVANVVLSRRSSVSRRAPRRRLPFDTLPVPDVRFSDRMAVVDTTSTPSFTLAAVVILHTPARLQHPQPGPPPERRGLHQDLKFRSSTAPPHGPDHC